MYNAKRPQVWYPRGKAGERLNQFRRSRGLPTSDALKKTTRKPAIVDGGKAPAAPASSRAARSAPPIPTVSPSAGVGLAAPAAGAPIWKFVGPTSIANGQTGGDTRVVVSGRISSIAIDPRDPNHLLVGSAAGGVWQSRDSGASWNPRRTPCRP